MQMQLELMPPPVLRLQCGGDQGLNRITWSYSRRGAFEQCPRRYFYQYYAAAKRGSYLKDAGQRVRFLKGLSNRHLRAGALITSWNSAVLAKFTGRRRGGALQGLLAGSLACSTRTWPILLMTLKA